MKRRLAIELSLLLLVVIVAAGYVLYCYQPRVRAVAWHVLHGDSVAVAGYRITVPSHWFVEQSASDDVHLWNTRTGESAWFHSLPKSPDFTLAFWSDLVQKRMNGPENPVVGKRDLKVAGEPVVCFERDLAVKLPTEGSATTSKNLIHLPSVECTSTGPLDVMFFGKMYSQPRRDYSEFYSLLASIQKVSR
jgi:hypothetical protein